MKKTNIFSACILAICPLSVIGQTHYLENLVLENKIVEKVGHDVCVNADIRLDEMNLNSQQSLLLVPVLVSADGSQEVKLRAVILEGKVRNKVTERKLALGTITDDGSMRIKRQNGKPQVIEYNAEVPFSRWMVNGRLEMRGYITGCGECSEGDEILSAGSILPYKAPVLTASPFIQPEEEEIKHRAENKTARLEYSRDSYAVLPNYRTNRAELDSVQHSLTLVKENPNLKVTGIYITGYASPEGLKTYNERLSKYRAQTFAEYIQKHNKDLDKDMWHVSWKGEDWDGFIVQVEQAEDWKARDMVQNAIAQCNDDTDGCEWKIRQQLSTDDYRYLIDELYAPLRRNEYRIEYNVRNFTLEEAKEILNTRPSLLSVAEIQRVADSYGRNSEGYRKALNIAVRTYPDNIAARNNAALAAIETEHYDDAIALLKNTDNGALLNMLGVAYWKNNQPVEAKTALRKASDSCYTPATENLRMILEAEELLGE